MSKYVHICDIKPLNIFPGRKTRGPIKLRLDDAVICRLLHEVNGPKDVYAIDPNDDKHIVRLTFENCMLSEKELFAVKETPVLTKEIKKEEPVIAEKKIEEVKKEEPVITEETIEEAKEISVPESAIDEEPIEEEKTEEVIEEVKETPMPESTIEEESTNEEQPIEEEKTEETIDINTIKEMAEKPKYTQQQRQQYYKNHKKKK